MPINRKQSDMLCRPVTSSSSILVTSLLLLLPEILVITSAANDGSSSAAAAPSASRSSSPLIQDYCQWEAFNASCPHGHIVVVESAQFGRMRLGRCVDTDIFIGCAADVLPLLDARCSGRPSCLVQLPDASLHQQQACPKDLVAYLEASYSCVDVGPIQSDECPIRSRSTTSDDSIGSPDKSDRRSSSSTSTSSSSDGVLASYYAQTLGHGRPGCPWSITVNPGQRIQLSLVDFSAAARYRVDAARRGHPQHHQDQQQQLAGGGGGAGAVHGLPTDAPPDYCYVYATVAESDRSTRRFTVCAEESREQIVYTSLTNSLTVEVTDAVVADTSINFVIKYSAVGCANMAAPNNGWVERLGDRVTIGCNRTTHQWHLVCKGTTWVGPHTHDCREGSPIGEKVFDDPPFPTYGLVIAVVIGVVVGSICGFLLLAVVLSCRRQRSSRGTRRPLAMTADIPLMLAPPGDSTEQHVCKFHGLATTTAGEYGYTHVWQLRPSDAGLAPIRGGSSTTDSAYQTSTDTGGGGGGGAGDAGNDPSGTGVMRMASDGSTVSRQLPPRRDHLYECPLFDERFLNRVPAPQQQQQHICRHHQPLYSQQQQQQQPPQRPREPQRQRQRHSQQQQQQHHALCPHGRSVDAFSSSSPSSHATITPPSTSTFSTFVSTSSSLHGQGPQQQQLPPDATTAAAVFHHHVTANPSTDDCSGPAADDLSSGGCRRRPPPGPPIGAGAATGPVVVVGDEKSVVGRGASCRADEPIIAQPQQKQQQQQADVAGQSLQLTKTKVAENHYL